MDNAFFAAKLLSAPLLPPLNILLLGITSLLLMRRMPRLATSCAMLALTILGVLSLPAGAGLVIEPLEAMTPPLSAQDRGRGQAIVVLGGGRVMQAPERGGQARPSDAGLRRLAYAARLHRETGLPIMLVGGAPEGKPGSEAAAMADTLRNEFGLDARWIEDKSRNTFENAGYTAALLRPHKIERVLLVTDAMHMPRAKAVFSATGLETIPAPASYLGGNIEQSLSWLPRAEKFADSSVVIREWIGIAWYALRHGK
jgi:uncharacterized SAM-binding protein YcdF (DUF218 family)